MVMKRKDVVALTGMCYTTIYNLENAGKFPARKQLSVGRVCWIRTEVEAWLNNLSAVAA
jgi:prophage regulatory protein